jgi:hypothetical protein
MKIEIRNTLKKLMSTYINFLYISKENDGKFNNGNDEKKGFSLTLKSYFLFLESFVLDL